MRYCLLVGVLFSGVIGCHQAPPPPEKRYIPPADVAKQGLDAVLKSWQAGTPPGMIPNTKAPQVHITDAHRKPGQKLEKYRILGEVPGDAGRCYAVKATFSNPVAEERIRFVVIGIDPLWVFRHEDLELLSHWEHKMDPVEEKKPAVPDKASSEAAGKPGSAEK